MNRDEAILVKFCFKGAICKIWLCLFWRKFASVLCKIWLYMYGAAITLCWPLWCHNADSETAPMSELVEPKISGQPWTAHSQPTAFIFSFPKNGFYFVNLHFWDEMRSGVRGISCLHVAAFVAAAAAPWPQCLCCLISVFLSFFLSFLIQRCRFKC